MGWLDEKVVTNMGFGNQADWDDASKTIDINNHTWKSMVKKCYRGDTLIYERSAWDYEYLNLTFNGNSEDIIITDITPFDASHKDRGWEFEVKLSVNSISTGALTKKLYLVCNTTTKSSDPSSSAYWSGGSTQNDDLNHSLLYVYDPGFGWGTTGNNNAESQFRMRGTDHVSDQSTSTGNLSLAGVNDGVAYNIFRLTYDKNTTHGTGNLIRQYSARYDSNDELIIERTRNGDDRYMNFSTSSLPIILGGCYYPGKISISEPEFFRVMGDSTNPVYMDFRFKYL